MSKDREDIFSISVTELLLIIMFALLIVMVLFNATMQTDIDEKEAIVDRYEEMTTTLRGINDALGLQPQSKTPASMELTEAVAQMQALVAALKKSVESDAAAEVLAKMKIDDVWSTLTKANSENVNIPDLLAAVKKANQALDECLDELRKTKELLAEKQKEKRDTESENEKLKKQIAKQQSENSRLQKENSNLVGQVENLSNGLEFPPCWATADGRAQYTYLVAVKDDSLVVTSVYPDERKEAYFELMDRDYNKTALSRDDFSQQLSIFYTDAVTSKPECRYFVKVADETSAGAKREYKLGLQILESIFYKYLMK